MKPARRTVSSAPAARAKSAFSSVEVTAIVRAPRPSRHLERGRADPARRAVHQHRLARAHTAPLLEREERGQVVQRQRRARVVRRAVRQREHRGLRDHHPLGGSAVGHHARHAGTGGDHGAGHVDAERERRLGLELVVTLAQQQVGEGDAHGVHLDQHLTRPRLRLGDVDDLDTRRDR